MSSGDFSETQKHYLQGFAMGSDVARKVQGLALLSGSGGPLPAPPASGLQPGGAHGAETLQRQAQDRLIAQGKTLSKEEQAKRDKDSLEMWGDMKAAARSNAFPKGTDVFLWKYRGLFYTAPNQNSYMCRLRIPGGELKSWQLSGIAQLAEEHGGGYVDVTTRANLQIREIPAASGCIVHEGLADLGIITRGAGADNVRNVTASATAGIDPSEFIDTLPLAKELHHHILNHRELYGLPRKFNISFDGGGAVPTLEGTNDIGFRAARVTPAHASDDLPEGVYFRLALGGITGHHDFARDTGILLRPGECIDVAHAILTVFINHGDRTDREKARLKYLLDEWGFEKFLAETEQQLGRPLRRVSADRYELPTPPDRWAHVGVHPQRRAHRHYIGLVLPVGRITCEQAREIARIAEHYGSGRIRLTVWQNLLIPDIHTSDVEDVKQAIEAVGLEWHASSVRSGLVACTGNAGCKYAASNTKAQALQLARHLEQRADLDVPINLHLTGCPNSCAQHYIGDIGFRGTKVEAGGDMVEGYEIVIGGGYADQQRIARQLLPSVAFDDIPTIVERLIGYYRDHRVGRENFADFANRHDVEQLRSVADAVPHAAH